MLMWWLLLVKCMKNRIDDFINMWMAKGWIVNKFDVEKQINIFAKAKEEIEF